MAAFISPNQRSGTANCTRTGSICVIVANLLMDVLNLILDPRLRTG